MAQGQTLPNNPEAEIAVIGSILLDPKYLPQLARIISPEDFYDTRLKTIFETLLKMQTRMQALDLLTLVDTLEAEQRIDSIGGSGYIASLVNQTPSAHNSPHYAKLVKKYSIGRQLVMAAQKITAIGQDSTLDAEIAMAEAGKEILGISAQTNTESHAVGEILNEYEALQVKYAEAAEHGKTILGDTTGFGQLDEMTQGFREHHIWIIGGYTSVGKTYFSLNLVRWLLEQNKRIVFYSLEMSKVDIISRLMAIMTEMPPQYILRGMMTQEEKFKYDICKAFLAQCDLTIYSEMHDLDQIKLSMIEESMRKPVGAYFLDYV